MYKKIINIFIFGTFLYSGENYHSVNFPLISILPFIGILLSIAFIPLINHHFWESHYGKIALFWSLLFFLPLSYYDIFFALEELTAVVFTEYIPFIILLFSLFTISGGIHIKGNLVGTPKLNSGFILLGTVLASWMGTTGAAMLMIRPLIKANKNRKFNVHIIIFFILLVANIGGALSPLGDPPLFLGFLKGINFFWTTEHLFVPMLIHIVPIIILFFLLDTYLYNQDKSEQLRDAGDKLSLQIDGKVNFLFILGVIFSVLLSGIWKPEITISIFSTHLELQDICRDLLLLLFAFLSWKLTNQELRKINGFTWFPILEVSKLFAGIFITIIPAIAILEAGSSGSLHGIIDLTNNSDGTQNNLVYFWLTGILSSFLDNAPTYLIFFNTAGGNPQDLMSFLSNTLLAISTGAVFFGAVTYIGNAPNFMVKSIAEENGIKMPSFFGYMIWSLSILVPIFTVYSILYF